MAPSSRFARRRWSGAPRTGTGRRTRCQDAPPCARARRTRTRATLRACPASVAVGAPRFSPLALARRGLQRGSAATSFDPTRAVHRGWLGARRLPGPRGHRPDQLSWTRRRNGSIRVGTARRPISGALAPRGIDEVRFAGGTWTFGAERAAVLAVFTRAGPDGRRRWPFYPQSATSAATARRSSPRRRRRSSGRPGSPPRHQDRVADPDGRGLAGRRRRTSSTSSSPTTCRTPGSRTPSRRSGDADARFVMRHGLSGSSAARRPRPAAGTRDLANRARRSRSSIGPSPGRRLARRGIVPARRAGRRCARPPETAAEPGGRRDRIRRLTAGRSPRARVGP